MLTFSGLPIAWSADLYWTGDELYATPPVAGDGSWRSDPNAVNWSDKRTSIANVSWIDGDVAHFLGSRGGTVTLETNITAGGISFDSGAGTFTIKTNGNVLGTLNVTGAGGFANTPGSYRLINYTGTLTGTASDLQIGRTPGYSPGDVFVQTVVPGQVNLITVLKGLPVEYWDGSGVAGSGVISSS